MSCVLVTGALGHIGSKLIKGLAGCDLVINDNMSTQRYCSLFNIGRDFTFWEKDFASISINELSQFDVVVHLAAVTDAAASMSNKESTLETNVTKTQNFIDASRKAGVKLFIFPSSTSVYGKSKEIMYEDDDNVNPQSVYAESKVDVEKFLSDTRNMMQYIIFRFGTIFGTSPGMRFHTAINKFCYQASFGQPLTIWKDNFYQSRPYVGINDAIHAINMAITGQLPTNEIYNVVSHNAVLSEIVEIIKEYKDIDINFVDTPLLNQLSYIVNNEKIENYGFIVTGDLEESIKNTLQLLGNK